MTCEWAAEARGVMKIFSLKRSSASPVDYVGQAPSQALYLDELRRTLDANPGRQRVLAYLKFLDGSLLIRLIEPMELRLKKRKGAFKITICDHALRAAWLAERVALSTRATREQPHPLTSLAGWEGGGLFRPSRVAPHLHVSTFTR